MQGGTRHSGMDAATKAVGKTPLIAVQFPIAPLLALRHEKDLELPARFVELLIQSMEKMDTIWGGNID